jgi:hypothetical protein
MYTYILGRLCVTPSNYISGKHASIHVPSYTKHTTIIHVLKMVVSHGFFIELVYVFFR